ncbi:VWA domain-containing protein [Symbioplanes lichenis]|uniref:VWA domain-containing protein n=1 Tax=Symbioplanes lichenis TaxID=1629072 RepID=UPI00273A2A40|nr:VWA domain-containing protein [Actinoplanes lichenis]
MSFQQPLIVVVAVLVTVAAGWAYTLVQRRRTAAWTGAGFAPNRSRRAVLRRHLPYVLLLVALPVLLVGLARPQAEVAVPHRAGTVVLAFDVSNSMSATDVQPSRLGAAQAAANEFVAAQADSVDIGVLPFGDQALLTQAPTDDRQAVSAAIARLKPGGGTSLGQAILVALGAVVGKPVALPEAGAAAPSLGYWPSATIVVFSDGQETGGPDVEAAAELAAAAGVRIQTVGVGTARGATVEVDGYQLNTALDESLLSAVAQVSGGAYHAAGDAAALNDTTKSIDLRLTTEKEPLELTGPIAAAGLLLLVAGALLGLLWHGRFV